ncbi:MAG: molybdenum cofactor guanylyltransferase, partial [Deltaproteobacteria bacterium]|nr:molybdenum cofactor guanylyltransferase [Deltaproteobacteria bacterium]
VGVKVTTIGQRGEHCPRGGEGCGVCASLEGSYCLTEETGGPPEKDTVRLLAAGARRVLWLRTLAACLPEAAAALGAALHPGELVVGESNSLRRVVEPGVFLLVKQAGSDRFKTSAQAVHWLADRLVLSDGARFDLDLGDLAVVEGRWVLQQSRLDATVIILAGGKSRRMGRDKSLLPVGGQPLIARLIRQLRPRFRQLLVSAGEPEKYAFLGEQVVADDQADQGPLMGIACALRHSRSELSFVVACDVPDVDIAFVEQLLGAADGFDVVLASKGPGRDEPLCAVYRKSAQAAAEATLTAGRRRISDMFDQLRVRRVPLGSASWMRNLNTEAEYEEYRSQLEQP